MDIIGIAPTYLGFQAKANLSQLNVRIDFWFCIVLSFDKINGNDGTRTRDNFIDSEAH